MRSSEIRKSLNIELLLFQIDWSQLRWFGHLRRMHQEKLPKQALLAKANGRKLVGWPRTRWINYIEDLRWNCLGLHPSEIMDVMEDREVWQLNLELLPCNPHGKMGNEKRWLIQTLRFCFGSLTIRSVKILFSALKGFYFRMSPILAAKMSAVPLPIQYSTF